MNTMYVCGNITNDIDVKKTQTGKSVCRFSVAVNEYGKDNQTKTTYIDCQAWEKTADAIGTFCGKGSKVLVEGKWQSSTYESNGVKKKDVVCLVNKIEFMNKKEVNETNAPIYESAPTISKEEPKQENYIDIKSEDLPFY